MSRVRTNRRLPIRAEHLGDDCHGRLAGDRAFDWLELGELQQHSQSYQHGSVRSSEISGNRAFVIYGVLAHRLPQPPGACDSRALRSVIRQRSSTPPRMVGHGCGDGRIWIETEVDGAEVQAGGTQNLS